MARAASWSRLGACSRRSRTPRSFASTSTDGSRTGTRPRSASPGSRARRRAAGPAGPCCAASTEAGGRSAGPDGLLHAHAVREQEQHLLLTPRQPRRREIRGCGAVLRSHRVQHHRPGAVADDDRRHRDVRPADRQHATVQRAADTRQPRGRPEPSQLLHRAPHRAAPAGDEGLQLGGGPPRLAAQRRAAQRDEVRLAPAADGDAGQGGRTERGRLALARRPRPAAGARRRGTGRGRRSPRRRRRRAATRGRSGIASTTSSTWKAIDSSAARTRCSRRVPRVIPQMSPRASGAQCGEPSPVSAGTK